MSNETKQLFETIVPVYVVFDCYARVIVSGEYKSRSRASARADKLDNMYGAYRYKVMTKRGHELTSY